MLFAPTIPRRALFLLPLLATSPVLQCQEVKTLEWRAEQQPTTAPCSADDLAFVSASEQTALQKSYSQQVFKLPAWECESFGAAAFNGARVLRVARPSVIDDGYAFTLIQPQGASSARLIPFSSGGNLLWGSEGDWHNRAAMNALLQSADAKPPEDPDWLAISIAYLTILGEEPTLADRHYAPGPTEHFASYTVPGLLREVPALKNKHLLPTAKCDQYICEVRFYYRTDPVEPLKAAAFKYIVESGKIWLASVQVVDYADPSRKKWRAHK